ncbi:hypothetical protein [Dyadobacter sp. LHD-138]|uniref:hypothetical protein n=1 Tax=Dyadobacter sp. LHD-138 TaxID=3071413 RepID=UPI0027E0E45D|nr:hypothetical protein [Dyadobacter sp. LHD-138]MDQ6482413.1 hypothetical protein [Dyadobacter sp. LHD-138]
MLHDVEKRSTTHQETDGSIVSPGHAKKGALTARQILFTQLNVPFEIREQIVGLVRHHGLPLWLFHKPDPQKALLKASFEVNTKLVAILHSEGEVAHFIPLTTKSAHSSASLLLSQK